MKNRGMRNIMVWALIIMLIMTMMPTVALAEDFDISNSVMQIEENVDESNVSLSLEGNGTEENPYLISTKEDLDNVRNDLSAHYKMTADIIFTEEDFEEGGAFYNDGEGWLPIGSDPNYGFEGVFDGNGHKIKGLKQTCRETDYGGLFGFADGATIKNLTMIDSEIVVVTESTYSAYAYAGGIVGYARDVIISNCSNAGEISVTAFSQEGYSSAYAGGIVGLIEITREGDNNVINDCSNEGKISADATDYAYAGGITGYVGGYAEFDDTAIKVTISGCSNEGEISADATDYAYAGGITGVVGGFAEVDETTIQVTISDCSNAGEISGTSSSQERYSRACAGGIVGYVERDDHETSIYECCNESEIFATSDIWYASYAGGIIGFSYETTIGGCNNKGDVASDGYAGGIVGYACYTDISNCDNNAAITSDHFAGGIVGRGYVSTTICDSNNYGAVSSSQAGGIVGLIYQGTNEISRCRNEGILVSSIAGGIAGGMENTTIMDCCNVAAVNVSENMPVNAYGISLSAGGIVGSVGQGNPGSSDIIRCYNAGDVNVSALKIPDVMLHVAAGGIVGGLEANITFKDCYNAADVTVTVNTDNVEPENSAVSTASPSPYADVYVGGIVGMGWDDELLIIENCYNMGDLALNTDTTVNAGGIIGTIPYNGVVNNSYYIDSYSKGIGYGIPDTVTKCTDAQMKKKATFEGFDFDNTWTMAGNESYPYPELRSVPMVDMEFIPGDADGSGVADSSDAVMILRALAGYTVEGFNEEAADFDGNGVADSSDAVMILRKLAGYN